MWTNHFKAYRTKPFFNVNGNKSVVVTYDMTVTNAGGYFDPDFGSYTAPLTGIYLFTFKAQKAPNSDSCVVHMLTKNNTDVKAFSYPVSTKEMYPFSVIVKLKRWDRVSVELAHGALVGIEDDGKMHFQGTLLHAEDN